MSETDSPPEPTLVARLARFRLSPIQSQRVAIGAAVMLALLVALFAALTWNLPLSRSLEPMTSPTLVLVTSDGQAFARRGAYKEAPVDAAKLPAHVTGAFVAIEDRRFYRHSGVDLRAIGRALVRNVTSGSVAEGGSTITQQLAKNAFTSGKRTLWRKGREAAIAVYLESRLSKNEILSRYLSSIYFGDGVFGLRGAARHYFDKTPETLSVGEAAMLAGLVKSPTKLAPTEHLEAAKVRMRSVLAAMVAARVIDQRQALAARNVKLRDGRPELPVGSYFADWVSADAKRAFDRAYGEVKVRTTLDGALQAQAEKALRRVLDASGDRLHATQGSVVVMRTDGSVLALVGGRDYAKSQFNRPVQAERQPGSAFKPFVYLAALRRGSTPESLVLDAPIKIGNWSPQNHESHYTGGPITLRQAFARSSNVAAVRLSLETGRAPIVQAARDLGITTPLPDDATIALGTANLTLMQLTAAYAGIASGLAPVTPYGLVSEASTPGRLQLGRFERQGLLELMRAVVTSGTGAAANIAAPAFGKTGTTQDYRDAYFIGFVGDVVIGVWVGNDDNSPMRGVVGGSLPAQIWREVMSYALSKGAVHVAPLLDNAEPGVEFATLPTEPVDATDAIDPVAERHVTTDLRDLDPVPSRTLRVPLEAAAPVIAVEPGPRIRTPVDVPSVPSDPPRRRFEPPADLEDIPPPPPRLIQRPPPSDAERPSADD